MRKDGFTLIEMILVLSIIALIATVSLTAIRSILKNIEIESTVINATQGILLTLNKARLESVINETYVPVVYENNVLTYDSSDIRAYSLTDKVSLHATPNLSQSPFTPSATMGFYLGFFVEEATSNLILKNELNFLLISNENDAIRREIIIEKGLPRALED